MVAHHRSMSDTQHTQQPSYNKELYTYLVDTLLKFVLTTTRNNEILCCVDIDESIEHILFAPHPKPKINAYRVRVPPD